MQLFNWLCQYYRLNRDARFLNHLLITNCYHFMVFKFFKRASLKGLLIQSTLNRLTAFAQIAELCKVGVRKSSSYKLKQSFEKFEQNWKIRFTILKSNEEQKTLILISHYNSLTDEFSTRCCHCTIITANCNQKIWIFLSAEFAFAVLRTLLSF